MKKLLIGTVSLALALSLTSFSTWQDEAAPQVRLETKVRKLLNLTGAAQLGKQVMDGMMQNFRQMPNLPDGFLDRFSEMADTEALVDLIVPIYVKHMDEPTLDGAIQFFESPVGRKMTALQPTLVQESMLAGQAWGQELAQRVLESLAEDR